MTRAAHLIAEYELVFLGLATPLLLFPGKWSLLGISLIVLTWACRWIAFGHLSARTAMDAPILVIVIMTVVALMPSVALDLSLNRMCIYLLGVALFYGMANGLHTEQRIHYMGIALVLLGLAVAVIGFLGTDWEMGRLIEIPAVYGRLPGPIIRGLPGSGVIEEYDLFNPRVVAGALAILAALPLAYLFFGEGWRLRLLSGLAALVMTMVLLLTQAPQGLLGLAAALILIAVWRSKWFLVSLVLGLGALLVAWSFLGVEQMIGTRLTPETIEALSFGFQSRVVNGLRGIGMIRDMPYTGIGLNTFPVVERLYTSGATHAHHAHNVVIQTAVDLGMPGIVALVALLAAFVYTAVRAYRTVSYPNQRALLIGICGAVTAWLAYGVLDSITLGHKPAAALWVMLGISASVRYRSVPSDAEPIPFLAKFNRRWALVVLVPVLVLLAVIGLTRYKLIGAFYLNLGVMEAHRALAADTPGLVAQHLNQAEFHMRRSLLWDPSRQRTQRLLDWVQQAGTSKKRFPRDTAALEGPSRPHLWYATGPQASAGVA